MRRAFRRASEKGPPMYKVMLIDDEDNLHAAIEKLLVQNGYALSLIHI